MRLFIHLILLCLCGLTLHFLMKWWEVWRTKGKISPWVYAMEELPMWIAAVVGALSCMLMLRSMLELLGLPINGRGAAAFLESLAFCSGYMGSSIAARIPTLLARRTGLDKIEDQK